MGRSAPDKLAYEDKIAKRFGGQKEPGLYVPTPPTVTPEATRVD